jgi:hypothetical protein
MSPPQGTTHVWLGRLLATHKNSTTKAQILVDVWVAFLAQRMVDFQPSQGLCYIPKFGQSGKGNS